MTTTPQGVAILGVGHRLPAQSQTNATLCEHLDVSPEWIVEKTGIHCRYHALPDESLWEYALDAARQALSMASLPADKLDLIIVCTFSGDYIFPPVAAKVQQQLAATHAQVFDLQANCAGFVAGLTVASDRLRVDTTAHYALVIGAEFCSRYVDPKDVHSAIYLSDGAGAAVLGPAPVGGGILASAFHTDSSNFEAVRLRGGGSAFRNLGRSQEARLQSMEMNGIATWKQAISHLPATMRAACIKANLDINQIDFIIFHQANLRLIEYLIRKLGFSMKQTYTNVERVGNSGAASLAIALSEAVGEQRIPNGATVMLAGMGAGFSFAANIWHWTLQPSTVATAGGHV